jgi:hypothetical protein
MGRKASMQATPVKAATPVKGAAVVFHRILFNSARRSGRDGISDVQRFVRNRHEISAAPTLSDIRAKLLGHSDQIGSSIAPLIFQLLLTRKMFSPGAQVTPWLEDQYSWQNLQIQKL